MGKVIDTFPSYPADHEVTEQSLADYFAPILAALESWLLMGRDCAEDFLDAQAFTAAHASALETYRLLTNVKTVA